MESKTRWRGFLYGGAASCLAEAATLPMDVRATLLPLGDSGRRLVKTFPIAPPSL
jgi:hypothetical protein